VPVFPSGGLLPDAKGEGFHDVNHDKVPSRHVSSKDHKANDNHHGGIRQFLELFEAFFLGIPWPSGFSEFEADFGKEFADGTNHGAGENGKEEIKKMAGPVGLEPTTNGFGDHYSTN